MSKWAEKYLLELFNSVVGDETAVLHYAPNIDLLDKGLFLNFYPTDEQKKLLAEFHQPLNVRTLFTREEVANSEPIDLLTKQVLHYIEVYGLNSPGLFNLTTTEGKKFELRYVTLITKEQLAEKVRNLIYANAPLKDSDKVREIIERYHIAFDINKVRNNELKCQFYTPNLTFGSGDDAVRYLVYKATGSALMVKDKKTVALLSNYSANRTSVANFLDKHKVQLAQVFNRHKRLILACKNANTKTVINQIARLSKKEHIPVFNALNKTFIAKAFAAKTDDQIIRMLESPGITLRDKFKYLNLLEWKSKQSAHDTFVIRNGKIHNTSNRKVHDIAHLARVMRAVLNSIKNDLAHLNGATIILDSNVDYGLPISRKQAVGEIPFGTRISVAGLTNEAELSYGIHWRNEWGARDLDLSLISMDGSRYGWGQYSGYDSSNGVNFSGDVTDATDGAMEFFTTAKNDTFGLFVNIFRGEVGAECELVIGTTDKDQWIDQVLFRQKVKLDSRGGMLGFVQNKDFIVWQGRLNDSHANFGERNPVLEKATMRHWTVKRLFDTLGIEYYCAKGVACPTDYNLTAASFTYEKLEELFFEKD